MMVRIAPSTIDNSTSASDSRMRRESSRRIVSVMSCGSCRSTSITMALTASATSTVLAPEILSTSSDTAGALELSRKISAAVRRFSAPSTTVATSLIRMGVPERTVTGISPNERGSTMRPVTRTSRSVTPPSMRPAGTSWFSRWSAAVSCDGDRP